MRAVFPAIAFAALSLSLGFSVVMAPPAKGELAVVFPPLTDEMTAWAIVRSAGAQMVGPTQFPNIVVAYAPDQRSQDRMRQLGALFFLAAKGLCSTPAQQV